MKGRRVPGQIEIENSAKEFRSRYAPRHVGPLDIERIVEKEMKIQIVPVRGLCRETRSKGFVCHGGKMICVDQGIFTDQSAEYRLLLAHEVGHVVRHAHFFPAVPFESIRQCRRWHRELPQERLAFLEWEARMWSGFVMVPRVQLRNSVKALVATLCDLLEEGPSSYTPAIVGMIAAEAIGAQLDVLPSVVQARMREDGLLARIGPMAAAGRQGRLGFFGGVDC